VGNSAAVLGWDDFGRAAYVISYDAPAPVVSERLDLGWGQVVAAGAPGATGTRELASQGIASLSPVFRGGAQEVLTSSGKLITRGRPAGTPHVFGEGDDFDGLIVLDIPAARLATGVDIRGGAITGFAADGPVLAFTYAHEAGVDDAGRPLVSQEYVRIELDSGQFTAPANVPGYVAAVQGAYAYLIEEQWGDGWAPKASVVVAQVAEPQAQVLDRLALPTGAYDFQSAGATLYYSTGSEMVVPVRAGVAGGASSLPVSTIGTVRLGTVLAMGPMIDSTDAFRWVLLPEEGAALVSRDAFTVEKWNVSSSAATLTWTAELSGYPMRARADPAAPGQYLLALGFAGSTELP
jgi:hypothetical protein